MEFKLYSTQLHNTNIYIISLANIFRVLSGATAGGLLSILVINYTMSVRATHSYNAIIWRLVQLSGAAYVDILGNYGEGEFINKLFGLKPDETNQCMANIIILLKNKAKEFEEFEDKNMDTNSILGVYKYDRTIAYIKDLTNIYYRDATNNTSEEDILKALYHCTDRGLILLGLLEGKFKQSGRLWSLAFFLELNMDLVKMLKQK